MTFSYSLLGALLLLLPGFGFYFGLRFGEETELISLRPDPPNSHQSIFLIVLGALIAHAVAAIVFGFNDFIVKYRVFIALYF